MKVIDSSYLCPIADQVLGNLYLQCHLSIFQTPTEEQVVLLTKLAIEIGWFKPFIIEKLATKIVQEFELPPEKTVWLQPYFSEFNQVIFNWQNGEAADAQWLAIAPDLVQELMNQDSDQNLQPSN